MGKSIKTKIIKPSKYKFEFFTNGIGFRLFRKNNHICTLFFDRKTSFKLKKPNCTILYSYNLYATYSIINEIVRTIIHSSNLNFKGWIIAKIGKSLAKKISNYLNLIRKNIDEKILFLNKKLFCLDFNRKPILDIDLSLLDNKKLEDIKKYRAASIYLLKQQYLDRPWYKWFGKPNKHLTSTLKKIPGNISIKLLLDRLPRIKLNSTISSRIKLLLMLLSNNENIRTIIENSDEKNIKEAISIYCNKYNTKIPRKIKDILLFTTNLVFNKSAKTLKDIVVLEIKKIQWEFK